jgi:predicted lipoprotein with Yx(FWY)xxD motif
MALLLGGCAPHGVDANADRNQPPLVNTTDQPSAAPSTPPPPPVRLTTELVAKKLPRMGAVVTDQGGWVLYRFDKDTAKPSKSNCDGACARIWPPAVTDGNPALTGVSAEKVGTVARADGGRQLTLGGWPLYRYAGDVQPGNWKGQAVNGTWFVSAPDGKKNLTCLPSATPTPVAPPPTEGGGGGY